MVIETPEGRIVTFVQIAGLIARRILCYADVGAKLTRGERYGFIRFGSRVDLYLPVDATVKVSLGDKVYGAITTLATFEKGNCDAGSVTQGP
jgi:phosphatidylserine decarboxylase